MNAPRSPATTGIAVQDVYLLPGEMRVATGPTRFLTILGSCVSVCLFDETLGIGSINHFLLPGAPGPGEQEPLRWSEPAIARLIAGLRAAGADPSRLRAKVFGGSTISLQAIPESLRIGDRNVDSSIRALARARIPVETRHTGGHFGRKIVFESHTGIVWVKELHTPSTNANQRAG